MALHSIREHKEGFLDALCLCYGWRPSGLPTTFVCELLCGACFELSPWWPFLSEEQ